MLGSREGRDETNGGGGVEHMNVGGHREWMDAVHATGHVLPCWAAASSPLHSP